MVAAIVGTLGDRTNLWTWGLVMDVAGLLSEAIAALKSSRVTKKAKRDLIERLTAARDATIAKPAAESLAETIRRERMAPYGGQ